jgi:protease IV
VTISPDSMFEREKLKDKIKKWQWLFFILLIVSIIIIGKDSTKKQKKDFIARMNIEGVIAYDINMINKINELTDDPNVKAVILNIDSPGSTAFAGEELYYSLKELSKNKPIVSVLKTLATSGGYMAALGTDYIVARNMSLTGSIGVLMQSFEVVDLADNLGVKFISLKSSPLKASPNPMEIMTKAAKEAVMETVDDDYSVFLGMLIESRKMTKDQAIKLADGRVYSGLRAKEINLIDEIGGENEALAWLEAEKNISSKTRIEDIIWAESNSLYDELLKFINHTNGILSSEFIHKLISQPNINMLTSN